MEWNIVRYILTVPDKTIEEKKKVIKKSVRQIISVCILQNVTEVSLSCHNYACP